MRHLKTFGQLNEAASYKTHPMGKHVITKEDAAKLTDLEADNAGPGPAMSGKEEELDKFMDEITGMTLADYAEMRWPDEPQKQFELALGALGINESLDPIRYSGGDVTKMPVIGKITTAPFKWGEHVIPGDTDDVVEVLETEKGKIYVINKWNKPGVPQLVHEDMVEKYEPIKK